MSNYLFISSDTPSELLVPVTPVNHELEAINDRLIYVPLATRNTFGVIKVGEGLNINNGLLSFDRSELDVKLSTNVGSENANKFLYVSDNGNITFVDQIQTITKVSELENDVGYITNDTTSLVNYYDSLKVDQLFTDAITEAEKAKAIAMGKADSKVFDTYVDMLNWLSDENNKGQLIVGSNLFIIADNEPDYWVTEVFDDIPTYIGPYPSYYSISPLESKLPDISDMVTTDTIQTISESKTFNKYITFNEDIRTSRIYTTALTNLISVSDNNLRIGALDGNNNLVLESWNRPTIQIINNTPEDIAFVSEIPTKVSELENDKNYVVGEEGKGLSTNDYTDAEKNKLSVLQNYDDSELRNLIDKKAAQSDLSNLANDVYEWESEIDNLSQNKVDKTITINGQPLDANVHLTIDDIGFTETDPTVPGWAKEPSKPTYYYSEILNTPTIPEGAVLYDTTGPNTDGSMTQKAVTDKLGKADVTNLIPSNQKQYLAWLRNTTTGYQYVYLRDDVYIDENGKLTDVRGTLASKNDIPVVPDLSNVAYKSDIPAIPTTLPNPYSFTVNGVSYNGSSAQSITGLLQQASLSLNTNGYMRLSNNFMIQWVSVTGSGNKTGQSFNFPTSFPNACLSVAMNHQISSKDNTDNMSITAFSKTGFTLACGHSSAAVFNVIAIGY